MKRARFVAIGVERPAFVDKATMWGSVTRDPDLIARQLAGEPDFYQCACGSVLSTTHLSRARAQHKRTKKHQRKGAR